MNPVSFRKIIALKVLGVCFSSLPLLCLVLVWFFFVVLLFLLGLYGHGVLFFVMLSWPASSLNLPITPGLVAETQYIGFDTHPLLEIKK
jgi:uncharacterized membrane protein